MVAGITGPHHATMLPACPKFIFIPPPRHQSNSICSRPRL